MGCGSARSAPIVSVAELGGSEWSDAAEPSEATKSRMSVRGAPGSVRSGAPCHTVPLQKTAEFGGHSIVTRPSRASISSGVGRRYVKSLAEPVAVLLRIRSNHRRRPVEVAVLQKSASGCAEWFVFIRTRLMGQVTTVVGLIAEKVKYYVTSNRQRIVVFPTGVDAVRVEYDQVAG